MNHSIPYIICENKPGENFSESERAYHVSEFTNPTSLLRIDKHYYIKNQISSPIGRLLSSIDGINFDRIASIMKVSKSDLGVDGNAIDANVQEEDIGERAFMNRFPDNFKLFEWKCPNLINAKLCGTQCHYKAD